MAKLPGMFKATKTEQRNNVLIVNFYVRWWHPSTWRILRSLMQEPQLTVWQRVKVVAFVVQLVVRSAVMSIVKACGG